MNLNFYNYNNYYNRTYKREDTLAAYGTPVFVQANVSDFSPNDGVSTTHVINTVNITEDPDYCVISDSNNIISRWFVLESKYTRLGQYVVTLYRDVLADNEEA